MKKIFTVLIITVVIMSFAECRPAAGNRSSEIEFNESPRPTYDNHVHIPGGTFLMGPAVMAGLPTDVQHEVTLSSFYMGIYPVTQSQYQQVTGVNPSSFKNDNMPVDQVSWYDAIEFCNRLSQREGLIPAYNIDEINVTWNRNANGYRLPTEAEWEYAARAGTSTNLDQESSHPWGLCEMPGEIYEWCWDWYDSYASGSYTDPAGAANGTNRVLRAGNYKMCEPRNVIVRLRSHNPPSGRGIAIGFRLVRS